MARQSSFPILFITATRIGDAVLSSGLIKRLADEIPNARFTVVAGPAAAPLFAEVPNLDRVIVFAKATGWTSGARCAGPAGAWWSTCAARRWRGSSAQEGARSNARSPVPRCTR